MSDKITGLTIVFDKSISEEACCDLEKLLYWIQGVVGVTRHIEDHNLWMARRQVQHEFREKLWKALEE